MLHKLHIVRHGTTDYNGDGKLRGWKDIPLSEKGKGECVQIAKKVKKVGLTGLIHSDLTRAKQTAEIISNETGVPIVGEDNRLRPWNLGDYTGQDVEKSMPILQRYSNELADTAIPGGESFNEFKKRFLTALIQILAKYKDQNVGLVAHYRNGCVAKARAAKGCPQDLSVDPKVMMDQRIEPGEMDEVDIDVPEAHEGNVVQGIVPALQKLLGTYKVYEWNQQMIHRQNRGKTNDLIHKRCDEGYKYAQEAIDEIAERMCMGLDGEIPTVMCETVELSTIKFIDTLPDCEIVAKYLVDLETELLSLLKQVQEMAEEGEDGHTCDMLGDFIRRHQVHQGFLKMYIPKVLDSKPIIPNGGQATDPKGDSEHQEKVNGGEMHSDH